MGVAGFPSLHWFAYGMLRPYAGGRRNDSLVAWAAYHARCPAHFTDWLDSPINFPFTPAAAATTLQLSARSQRPIH